MIYYFIACGRIIIMQETADSGHNVNELNFTNDFKSGSLYFSHSSLGVDYTNVSFYFIYYDSAPRCTIHRINVMV